MYNVLKFSELGVSPGSKLCTTFLNLAKNFKILRTGCVAFAFIFSIYLKPVLYMYISIIHQFKCPVFKGLCCIRRKFRSAIPTPDGTYLRYGLLGCGATDIDGAGREPHSFVGMKGTASPVFSFHLQLCKNKQ